MSNVEGPKYKFSQQGIDDIVSRIKDLHNELRTGQISYQDYRKEIKEATEQGKAATQEFGQLKGAIAASNPGLLEFTRTMSTFGSVANTVLGIQNAINLATLASQGIDRTVADDKVKLAEVTNQAAKDLAAFGPNSAQYQTDMQLKGELTNKLAYDQQQLARQSFATGVTLVASAISTVGSISQMALAFKTLGAEMSAIPAGNFAIALAGVGSTALAVLGPIAIVAGAVYGLYYLYRSLSPEYASATDEIYNAIISNWHLDSLSATLLTPWVAFVAGLAFMGDDVENIFISIYNGILQHFVNPLISTWDSTLGHIFGTLQQISPQTLIHQSLGDVMNEIGLGSPTGAANPRANSINQFLLTGQVGGDQIQPYISQMAQNSSLSLTQGQQDTDKMMSSLGISHTISQAANNYLSSVKDSMTSQIAATNSQTSSQTAASSSQLAAYSSQLAATNTGTSTMNTSLQQINSGISGLLQPIIDQKAAIQQAKDATNQQIANLKQIIEDNSKLPQTQQVTHDIPLDALSQEDSLAGRTTYTTTKQSDAAKKIANAKAQLAQLQSASNALDVSTSGIGPVLASIGLSSESGLGSVIAGALGGYGSIGGAGLSPRDIQNFVNTHDYGVFTNATLRDNTVSTPSHQQQIDALLNTWQRSGLTGYTAADAARALGYSGGSGSSGSSNYNPGGAFGGLPGQYGNPAKSNSGVFNGSTGIFAASGFEGVVSAATHFVAGEAGPEAVSIKPLSKGGGQGNTYNIYNNFEGSLHSDQALEEFIDKALKKSLKQVGF